MRSYSCVKSILALVLLLTAAGWGDGLEQNFTDPPTSARPHTWWHWMNGNVTQEGIAADLEAMQRVGLGGFQAFHVGHKVGRGPVDYMTPKWLGLMDHTISEAQRLGLEVCMHNCAGWSSSGGPWVTPEYSMKKVVWSETTVEGPQNFESKLDQPESKLDYYRDIAILAFPTPDGEADGKHFRIDYWDEKAGFKRHYKGSRDPKEPTLPGTDDIIAKKDIVMLSGMMDEQGQLRWQVPAGKWTVIRFGYTTTGAKNRPALEDGLGLECDKFSRSAAKLHWDNTVQKVIDKVGPLAGRTFKNILIDSYEVYCQNWTAGFADEFYRRCGYELWNYLPCLTGRVVDSLDITERFLEDFRRVIAELFTENYFGYFADMCHRNGLVLSIEPYGSGNFNDFITAGIADISMGEWWANVGQNWHHWSAKLSASAAHTYGRKFVGAEAFTAGWQSRFINHPYLLKAQGDYFYCKGINRFIFHTYVHQPWPNLLPGMTMGPYGFQFNRNNTWFDKSSAWLNYLARCQYLLQEGQFVADVCYYVGEQYPQRAVIREELTPSLPAGYDYDFCTSEILFQMQVEDGLICLPDGMKYRLLIWPDGPARPAVLHKLRQLVHDGAMIYGSRPTRAPGLENYPECDKEVEGLAENIWTAKNAKGRIFSDSSLTQILQELAVLPDFEFSGEICPVPTLYPGTGVEYIHRQIAGADVYFVSNQNYLPKKIDATFRIRGLQPELWHPASGLTEDCTLYSATSDGRTNVPLTLDKAESVFVVFRKPPAKKHFDNIEMANAGGAQKDTPQLEIIRAIYGALDGTPNKQVDVTDKLRAMIQNNYLYVKADNSIAGDPAHNTIKGLRVDYSIDGQEFSQTISENEVLSLPEPQMVEGPCYSVNYQDDKITLSTSKNGVFEIQQADNKTEVTVDNVTEPITLEGPWKLHFPAGWGTPEELAVDNLFDWINHENYDIQHFSGTVKYSTALDVAADHIHADETIKLDLGDVQVIATVRLNGTDLGILWQPPFRVDVSNIIKAGTNQLEIEVTNLWANRLIGDEKYPDDEELEYDKRHKGGYYEKWPEWLIDGNPQPDTGRKTFVAWRHYKNKNEPLLSSGLLGPVRLLFYKNIVLE